MTCKQLLPGPCGLAFAGTVPRPTPFVSVCYAFNRPSIYRAAANELLRLQSRLAEETRTCLAAARVRLESAATRLRLLSPLNVLDAVIP